MWTALTSLVLLAAPASASGPPPPVEVGVGEQTVLEFPGLTRIAVGDPQVADVRAEPSGEVLLTGKGEGQTTLLIWTKEGGTPQKRQVQVTRGDHGQSLEALIHAIAPDEDLHVREYNGKHVVEGRVRSRDAAERLKKLAADEPDVVMLAELDPASQADTVDQINAAFARAGLKNAHAVRVGKKIFLEGQVDDEAEAHKAQLIAESIAGSPVETSH